MTETLVNLTMRAIVALQNDDMPGIADSVCEARIHHFIDKDGNPDYAGRSYAYRVWFGDLVDTSGVPEGDRSKVMAKVRYHMGNVLRKKVPAEDLEAAGMMAVSPRQRGQAYHEHMANIYQTVKAGTKLKTDEELSAVVEVIDSLTKRVDTSQASPETIATLFKSMAQLQAAL